MDSRYSAHARRWWKELHSNTMTATFIHYGEDEDGEFEEELTVPIQFKVCPSCNGKGSYVNPNIDAHGLTWEDFEADPDFYEDYRTGRYDVPCGECEGMRVVPYPTKPEHIKMIENRLRFALDIQAEMDAERRMGA